MCGINFILDKQQRLDLSPILRMNEAIQHRGRDYSGTYQVQGQARSLFFGHNRLKIIDLADTANQPMRSPCGRYVLVFNGEIYNYKSLKKRLETKYAFQTASDSEVLMYFLADEPTADLGLLEGIFAFVWYDTHTDTLRYARDSFGIKPLYKYEDARFLILSSEIQGILGSGLVGKCIDDSQIYHYLAYRYAEPTRTFFKGIEPVAPCPKTTLPTQNREALPALASAVVKQTVGDVPFGIFLSGGVDSTLLLALLREQGHTNLPAFTIVHPAKEASFGTSDAHFARLASRQYGAKLHTLEIDSSALEALPAFIDRIDQPIADGAYWLTEMLSAEARKSVKFVFSGAGADELFSGYNRHKAYHFYKQCYGLLMLGYPFLKVLAKILPTGFAHPYRQHFRLIKKFGQDISLSSEKTWQNFIRLSALPAPPVGKGITSVLHDQQYYLQHDVLALTDRASMLHALEVRVPYLDAEVVNYAQNLPLAYQLKHGKKWVLKKMLSDLGGKVYTTRRKEGFGVPIGAWLRAPVGKVYIDLLQNPQSILYNYLPARYIQTLVKQHLSYQTDATAELWALLVLEMWLQRQT